jgi:hypothetical protein
MSAAHQLLLSGDQIRRMRWVGHVASMREIRGLHMVLVENLRERSNFKDPSIDVTMLCFFATHCSLKAYCAIWVRRSNFRHQASPRVSPRESTQRRKLELWARNVREFCLNADFCVTCTDLLHAVRLRHGTDGFTSPPKEGVLRNFSL